MSDERERRSQLVVEGNTPELRDCPKVQGRRCDCPSECVPACVDQDVPDLEADGYGWLPTAMRDRVPADCREQSTVATEAHAMVYGDRQGDYGHPRDNFTVTAQLWTIVLQSKLADGEYVTPEDVALAMLQVKVARELHSPKRDNKVDGIGYLIALDRLESGR